MSLTRISSCIFLPVHKSFRSDDTSIVARVANLASKTLDLVWKYLQTAFSKLDTFLLKVSLKIEGLILELTNKVQSVAADSINHAFKSSSAHQTEASLNFFERKLSRSHVANAKKHAYEICSDPDIFSSGGCCLGYSYMFGVYLMKNMKDSQRANQLLEGFKKSKEFTYAPLAQMLHYVDTKKVTNFVSRSLGTARNLQVDTTALGEKQVQDLIQSECSQKIDFISLQNRQISLLRTEALVLKMKDLKTEKAQIKDQKWVLESLVQAFPARPIELGFYPESGIGHSALIYSDPLANRNIYFDSNTGIYTFNSQDQMNKFVSKSIVLDYEFKIKSCCVLSSAS